MLAFLLSQLIYKPFSTFFIYLEVWCNKVKIKKQERERERIYIVSIIAPLILEMPAL